jgi:hypothetical protein
MPDNQAHIQKPCHPERGFCFAISEAKPQSKDLVFLDIGTDASRLFLPVTGNLSL